MTEKKQPHSELAERSVLGVMFAIGDSPKFERHFERICEILKAPDFHILRHKIIFEAMTATFEKSKIIDTVLVMQYLDDSHRLEATGGPAYLTGLMNDVISPGSVMHHIKIVKRKSIRRHFYKKLADAMQDDSTDEAEIIDDMIAEMESLRKLCDEKEVENLEDAVFDFYEDLLDTETYFYETGYPEIDKNVPIEGEDVVIIGARPGVGKTAFAVNLAISYCKQGYGVFFASLEMSKRRLLQRMAATETNIPGWKIKKKRYNEQELKTLKRWSEHITENWDLRFHTDKTADSQKLCRVFEDIVSESAEKAPEKRWVAIIDYLQLIPEGKASAGRGRQEAVSEISRTIKLMNMVTDSPVFALSQLNRQGDMTQPPQLKDLRESGAIEQDASIVLMMQANEIPEGTKEFKRDMVIAARKNREGPPDCMIKMELITTTGKFQENQNQNQNQNKIPFSA